MWNKLSTSVCGGPKHSRRAKCSLAARRVDFCPRAGVAWILQPSHRLGLRNNKVLSATLEWKYFKVGLKWIQVRMHTVEHHLLKVVHDAAQSCTKKAFRISPVKYSKPERSAVQDPQSKWSEHDFHRFGDKVMDVHDNAQHQPLKMIPRHLLCY